MKVKFISDKSRSQMYNSLSPSAVKNKKIKRYSDRNSYFHSSLKLKKRKLSKDVVKNATLNKSLTGIREKNNQSQYLDEE